MSEIWYMRISTHKNIACSQRQMQVNTRRRNSTRIYLEDVCTSFRAERRETLEALESQHGKRGKRRGGGGCLTVTFSLPKKLHFCRWSLLRAVLKRVPENRKRLFGNCYYSWEGWIVRLRVRAFFFVCVLSLIHIWRCRRGAECRSRWSPYH